MPGLSDYAPKEPDYVRLPDEDEPQYFMGPMELPPELIELMKQRLQEYYGFADPTRTMPDSMAHGMTEAIPPDDLENPVQLMDPYGRASSDPYTYRQLIEVLRDLSPQRSQESP